MVLKTVEGTAMSMFKMIKAELMSSFKSKMAAAVLKPNLKQIANQLDYSEYGGAALFGLKAPVIKSHGSSDSQAIFSAIRQTGEFVQAEVVKTIETAIQQQGE